MNRQYFSHIDNKNRLPLEGLEPQNNQDLK